MVKAVKFAICVPVTNPTPATLCKASNSNSHCARISSMMNAAGGVA